MSERDREKWNARYREGAYAARAHPSPWVTSWVPRILEAAGPIEPGNSWRALDVACGAGRNALWLAEAGFEVDAVDIAEAALERGRAAARARRLAVDWQGVDLDAGLPVELDGYALIVVIRYLNRELLQVLPARLRPGGWLLCEVHLSTDADVIGPTSAAFRVAPGELGQRVPGLEILALEEGLFEDPDGRPAALARLVARRPA